ncbi:hypothetical protein FWZ03_03080 [Escherichia coli]|uniref:glycosyltransferase family 2 protein n=1 Tax=Escherichia coli TaxID=562 RepID=UPI000DA57446|nr:hypothetical protein [Escherichia coli]EFC2171858.1 hypothetical protein [Escherichia coli]EFN4012386.1 hypothetical protein [Escherichia coli]EFN4022958.1 hypothetical protein [Escherichia coli]EFN4075327.1 hypothetical protein [Escherichia coli]EFN6076788.1 hypothetical protein [Escherichia coli]
MLLTIIVVIYGKNFCDSASLKSLRSCQLNNIKLVVYNNGPIFLDSNDCYDLFSDITKRYNFSLEVIQEISNRPLSKVYNHIIEKNMDSEYFMILDDDTEVPINYFPLRAFQLSYDIGIPMISVSNDRKVIYPEVNGEIITKEGFCEKVKNIKAISSGLVIHNNVIIKIKNSYPDIFDTRFAFYGVDFTFLRRIVELNKLYHFRIYIENALTHSLSRVEGDISQWRYKERVIDVVLTSLLYEKSKVKAWRCIMKLLLVNIIKLRYGVISVICSSIVKKKHPRC